MAHPDASVRDSVRDNACGGAGLGGGPPPVEESQRQPWDPFPGEPQLWFSRFNVYLKLSVGRTLERAYQDCMAVEGGKAARPGSA